MEKTGYVYIMASARNGTLYIGVTSNLVQRAWQHREAVIDGFTKTYGCKMLVWYQDCGSIDAARTRELQLKTWRRGWKLGLIEAGNPDWEDLFPASMGILPPLAGAAKKDGRTNEHPRQ